jgi:hypothetical protein
MSIWKDKFNLKHYLLDPFSVIVKLAILGKKPIGTKIMIQTNCFYFQEPGLFQSIARAYYNSNKIDIQYLFNPIYQACETFLKENNMKYALLFISALEGLKRLMETYSDCSIIGLCLSYYYCIIDQYIQRTQNSHLFYKDNLSDLYTPELIRHFKDGWTEEKIKIVLNIVEFLAHDQKAESNIKSLETLMDNNDVFFRELFLTL